MRAGYRSTHNHSLQAGAIMTDFTDYMLAAAKTEGEAA